MLCVLCLIVLWGFSLVTSYSGVIDYGTALNVKIRRQFFRTDGASNCFYFWVVVVWLERRTGRKFSWQFVALEDDGQETRLFVVKTFSYRLNIEAK